MGRFIDYADGEQALRGYFAPPPVPGPHPGVFLLHTWMGLSDSIPLRADRLAAEGFAVFALDVFGAGVIHQPPETAREVVAPYAENQELLRRRVRAGLAQLKRQPETDPSRSGGLGYCFGGFAMLEMARDGEVFQAGVALHAELQTRTPMQRGRVVPRLLILHGDGDPVAPGSALSGFLGELRSAGATWELNLYGGALHSFTGEGAWGDTLPEARLDPYAEAQSWQAGIEFLHMVLQPATASTLPHASGAAPQMSKEAGHA